MLIFWGTSSAVQIFKKMLSISFTLTPICFELFHTGAVWVINY